jgi:hypothetical protein
MPFAPSSPAPSVGRVASCAHGRVRVASDDGSPNVFQYVDHDVAAPPVPLMMLLMPPFPLPNVIR